MAVRHKGSDRRGFNLRGNLRGVGQRVRTFPYEIIVFWERHHGELTKEQYSRFLENPSVAVLGEYPSHVVEQAIARSSVLSEAVDFAKASMISRSSVIPPLQARLVKGSDLRKAAIERGNARERAEKSQQIYRKPTWKKGLRIRRAQVWAVEQRANPTEAERQLELILKRMFPDPGSLQVQWIFGKPSSPYIFDFYIPQVWLGIEVDGSIHEVPEVKANDEAKTVMARSIGITVRRMSNEQVLTSTSETIICIVSRWCEEASRSKKIWENRPR